MSRASIINALQSIINKSNETTGASDTTVTSASDRLIRGYGGGATNIIADVTVSGDDTQYISFPCAEEPDAVIIYPTNWTYSDTTLSALVFCAMRTVFVLGLRQNTSTTKSSMTTDAVDATDYPWGTTSSNYKVSGEYSNGIFTARSRGASAQSYWSSEYAFRCIGIKL
jgi:hypothetical protein